MRSFKVFAIVLTMAWLFSLSASAQLTTTKAGGVAGGGVVNPCTGTLDLSKGCPLPMLGAS